MDNFCYRLSPRVDLIMIVEFIEDDSIPGVCFGLAWIENLLSEGGIDVVAINVKIYSSG